MAQRRGPRAARHAGGKLAGLDLSAADSMRIKEAGRHRAQLLTEVQTAKVARAVMSERQLEEVMVDFWENHFTVFAGKGRSDYFLGAVRAREHPAARAREIPRSARRRREESRDALLSRQLGEHGRARTAPALGGAPHRKAGVRAEPSVRSPAASCTARRKRGPRAERELWSRADGAPHARRRRRLHPGRM